jgi:hypothetical protein
MAGKWTTPTENITHFFDMVRQDSGLQGQIFGHVAEAAPEVLSKVAGQHGFAFTGEELKQFITNRAVRSLQGDVFWATCRPCPKLEASTEGEGIGAEVRFCQICGPSWVNQAPYRKALPPVSEKTDMSLSDLFREIQSEIP